MSAATHDVPGLALVLTTLVIAKPVSAQTDEIQVYDAQIAAPGIINLTWHNNYTPAGLTQPAFPGGIVPNHDLNGVAEWAYGIAPWMEGGLYFPLYSVTSKGAVTYNGLKVRMLFVSPDAAARAFFYGINLEFSVNTARWDSSRYTQELRPILGWHVGAFDFIFNPILDNSYKGFGKLDFAPASRIAYNLNSHWVAAVEEYTDLGPLDGFYRGGRQVHQLFGVFDFKGANWSIEGGAGLGLTGASDHLVFKLILSHDFNRPGEYPP